MVAPLARYDYEAFGNSEWPIKHFEIVEELMFVNDSLIVILCVRMAQSPFVLCRLFRKPEDKSDALKHDEVDQTGSSRTTTKSSPDDTSSDLFQETATSDMQCEQSQGIKSWLADNLDTMTPFARPVESCSNSYMASDVTEETPLQVGICIPLIFVFAYS